MKIRFHKLNNEIVSWSTGGETSVQGTQIIDMEISNAEFEQLQTFGFAPKIVNGVLILTKTQQAKDNEIKKQNRKDLKAKFQSGNFTNADVKKLAEILL